MIVGGQGLPESWGFRGHIEALSRQIEFLEVRLNELIVGTPKPGLKKAGQHLLKVCGQVKQEARSFANGLNGLASENQWARWIGTERKSRALSADCLALEQSIHFRGEGRLERLCIAADRLAESLSNLVGDSRPHYVLVSEAEHFGADASAIHLSYGHLDIWNFNRLIHEFGHLWGEEAGNGDEGAQTLFLENLKNWTPRQGKEFFADIMATYLAGPAFAYPCLLLDFNPADRVRSESHPAQDERAHCILVALNFIAKCSHEFTSEQFNGIVSQLGKSWETARAAAGAKKTVANLDDLEYATEVALDSLAKEIPDARYQTLSNANSVRNAIANCGHPPAGTGAVDILNGAWLRRVAAPPEDESEIAMAALKMLLEVL